MTDTFRKHSRGLTAPPENATAIQPADGTPLSHASRAIYVGGAGTLRVEMLNGEAVSLIGVAAGSLLPIRVRKVFQTGTTASGLVAFW